MNNWKQSTFMGFLEILVLILALVACNNDDNGHKHDWEDWVIIKEPTTLKEGEKTHICKICEETETVAIAKLPDPPKNQTADLENLFGEDLSTTITAFLTDLEWYGIDYDEEDDDDLGAVANKIKVALNDAFNSGPTSGPMSAAWKNRFTLVFNAGYNIEVVKTSEQDEWNKWKATEDEWETRTILLSFKGLDNDLQESITNAVEAISGNKPDME